MSEKQESLDPQWWNFMVVNWHENQTAITFQSNRNLSEGSEKIIESLHLEALNQFLNMHGFNLKSFTLDDVPSPSRPQKHPPSDEKEGPIETLAEAAIKALEERIRDLEEMVRGRFKTDDDGKREKGDTYRDGENPINSPTGKYLFPSPSNQGTTVVGFFHVETSEMAYSKSSMGSMDGNGGKDGYGEQDNTRQLVNLINRNLDTLKQGNIPVVAAMPNWLSTGAGCITHTFGVPPIPVSQGNSCTSSAGLWPITLPDLSDTMQGLKGDGVTVFVLDSMPAFEEIINAANSAGNNNLLLQKIVQQISGGQTPSITLKYQYLGQGLDENTPEQPKSGDDLYGRPFSFPSSDHGLFITGIVRDLASGATLEYIRVLNDFGVGDTTSLLDALSDIQKRMGEDGDLHNKPVVINLSMEAIPSQEDLARLWFNADCSCQAEEFVHMVEDIEQLQLGLHLVIQSLTELGAVIVASAGNDSSIHQWDPRIANPAPRKGPSYPAAFPEVISVGAVDKQGRAAPYSNYPQLPPQHNGIATLGGGVPTAVPPVGPGGTVPLDDFGPPDPHTMTTAIDVDGVIGVYTAPKYPALAADDQSQSYDANTRRYSYDWAYWSGTSFAAPIISAVAARVLQLLQASSLQPYQRAAEVQRAITTPGGESALLTGGSPLPLQTDFGFGVRMLRADQCVGTQQDSVASVTAGAAKE